VVAVRDADAGVPITATEQAQAAKSPRALEARGLLGVVLFGVFGMCGVRRRLASSKPEGLPTAFIEILVWVRLQQLDLMDVKRVSNDCHSCP
jgi:hypothetical protein